MVFVKITSPRLIFYVIIFILKNLIKESRCQSNVAPPSGLKSQEFPSGSMRPPPSGSEPKPSGSMMKPPRPGMNNQYSNFVIDIENFGNTNISKYITNYGNRALFTKEDKVGYNYDTTLDSMGLNSNFTIYFYDESTGVQVNYLSMIYNGSEVDIKQDLRISASISNRVFPINYFNTSNFNINKDSEALLECKYTNPGPEYRLSSLKNVDIDNIVTTTNKNFGLKKDENGIKVLLMNDRELKYIDLDDYLTKSSKNQNFTRTKNIKFQKLFTGQNALDNNTNIFHLAAIGADNNLYLYNILDDSYDTLQIDQWDIISSNLFNFSDVNKVVFYNGQVYTSSVTMGFSILTKNTQWGLMSHKDLFINNSKTALNLLDIAIVNNTLFMIADKVGLLSWDIASAKMNKDYFQHPNLVRIDYTIFRSSAFIGVCVNNSVINTNEIIPEIFIEFLFNFTNPSVPLINKVYTSMKDIKVEDVVSDNYLGLTYLIERSSTMLTVLTRGIMNILTSYNFRLDLKNLVNNPNIDLMLIAQNNQYYPSLIIKNGKDFLLVSRFSFPQTDLVCKPNRPGKYQIHFKAPSDCSANELSSRAFYCYINNTVNFFVDSELTSSDIVVENKTGLWVILGILIFIILSIVVVVMFCKISCFKKTDQKIYHKQVQSNRDGGELEIKIEDNKL